MLDGVLYKVKMIINIEQIKYNEILVDTDNKLTGEVTFKKICIINLVISKKLWSVLFRNIFK